MKLKLPRYRWWLLIACLAVAIGVIWWQLSDHRGRFTREQYDRIRLGMTPAEISQIMGCPPMGLSVLEIPRAGMWEGVARDPMKEPDLQGTSFGGVWSDGVVAICIRCRDSKVVTKSMIIYLSAWQLKTREWLYRLRGLVGL
jgi:hypothetical protein